MFRMTGLALLAAIATGCGGGSVGDGKQIARSEQWFCEAAGTSVSCGVAMLAAEGESGAYACAAGELRVQCPPAIDLGKVDGLDDLLAEYGLAKATLEELPWACLLTGDHQRHCVKNVEAASRRVYADDGAPGDQTGDGSGDGEGDGSGEGDGPDAPAEDPVPPETCEPEAWEGYFRDHATFEYQRAGIDIDFPQEIFDVTADFTDLALEAGNLPTNPGAPSCHEGEWAMREGAWFDATMEGCLNLSDPILVMCQQAANYAPQSGACNATASW